MPASLTGTSLHCGRKPERENLSICSSFWAHIFLIDLPPVTLSNFSLFFHQIPPEVLLVSLNWQSLGATAAWGGAASCLSHRVEEDHQRLLCWSQSFESVFGLRNCDHFLSLHQSAVSLQPSPTFHSIFYLCALHRAQLCSVKTCYELAFCSNNSVLCFTNSSY